MWQLINQLKGIIDKLKEVKVPVDYKGDTFCGIKVVKGDIKK